MSKVFKVIGIIVLIGISINIIYAVIQNQILNTPDGYRSFTSNATHIRFIKPKDYSREWNQSCTTKSTCDSHYFTYKSYHRDLNEVREFSYRQSTDHEYNLDVSKERPSFTNQYNIQWYPKIIERGPLLLDKHSLCAYRESDATTHCFEGFDYDLIREIAEHARFTRN